MAEPSLRDAHVRDTRRALLDTARELFAELETYGVRHEDRDLRNITYRNSDGRFCIIDFEFATLLEGGPGAVSLKPSAAQ